MALYEVTIKEIEIYTVTVEAADEEGAIDIAERKIETREGKSEYHNGSDGEVTVYEA